MHSIMRRNVNETMLDSVHHAKPSHESTLFQVSPLKFLGHGSGAAVMAKVKDIPSCISLDHLQLVDVDFGMWAPHCRGIF